jgi:sigma-B regulation protein RsbU (phosphoserine phosphatase)
MFEITKSIPVGLFEDFDYTESTIQLQKGDKIFMYTDGVTEAENIEKDLYSTDRLLKFLRINSRFSPEELIKLVDDDVALHVNKHSQSDDLTMMSIVFYG